MTVITQEIPASVEAVLAPPAAARNPVSLGLFAIPLGFAGLAGTWLAAEQQLGAPAAPEEVLYAVSAVCWIVLTSLYVRFGLRRFHSFQEDLKHPGSGAFTSFIPAVAVLLSAHYAQYWPEVGRWVTAAFVTALFLIAAQLFATWFSTGIEASSLNSGFYVPIIAGPFIASIGLTTVGFTQAGLVVMGAGLFFWITFGTIVMNRHITGSRETHAVSPSLSAFLAAPATGGVGWIISHPGPIDEVQYFLTGVLLTMLLIQLILIGAYRKLKFSLQFWVFTFPAASTVNFIVRWLAKAQYPGWSAIAWGLLGIVSIFFAIVAVGSVVLLVKTSRRKHTALRQR